MAFQRILGVVAGIGEDQGSYWPYPDLIPLVGGEELGDIVRDREDDAALSKPGDPSNERQIL